MCEIWTLDFGERNKDTINDNNNVNNTQCRLIGKCFYCSKVGHCKITDDKKANAAVDKEKDDEQVEMIMFDCVVDNCDQVCMIDDKTFFVFTTCNTHYLSLSFIDNFIVCTFSFNAPKHLLINYITMDHLYLCINCFSHDIYTITKDHDSN